MELSEMRKERRDSSRVQTPDSVANCRLLAVESGGKFQFTVWPVRNIGRGGVAISSEEKVTKGALAFLNMDLDIIMKTIGVIAKVIWCKKKTKGYDIGLSFSWWPNAEDKLLVSDFVSKKVMSEEVHMKHKKMAPTEAT